MRCINDDCLKAQLPSTQAPCLVSSRSVSLSCEGKALDMNTNHEPRASAYERTHSLCQQNIRCMYYTRAIQMIERLPILYMHGLLCTIVRNGLKRQWLMKPLTSFVCRKARNCTRAEARGRIYKSRSTKLKQRCVLNFSCFLRSRRHFQA